MFKNLSGESLLYPIMGDPIRFVRSPAQLTERFSRCSHNGICVPMQVPQGDLARVLQGIEAVPNVRGLLITMPHKKEMFKHCSTSSEAANLLEVVSVTRRNANGTWHGEMLDGLAFVSALKKAGAKPSGARVLQVGAGSAGSAIAAALLNEGVTELALYDTNEEQVNNLMQLLTESGPSRVTSGTSNPSGFDIVVNATPLGMNPTDPLPIVADHLHRSMFVGDVIAGHGITPLLQAAQTAGCKTVDGAGMVEAGIELMVKFFLSIER